jgi:muramoyltetrapeptide carboxypeptidase LdcA involved in peptidoglycan recycling
MRLPLVRPPALLPGDTVGVFAPSSPMHVKAPEKYRHGLEVLRRMGYGVREGSLTASGAAQGYRSGTPRERAAELMELVLDPSVRAVIATIGGMNSSSMIPYLDFDAIRANPKVMCGFSDVTSLHLAVLARAGVSTFYGPAVLPNFAEWPDVLPETRDSFLAAVTWTSTDTRVLEAPTRWSRHAREWSGAEGPWKSEPRQFERNDGWRTLRTGEVRGPVLAVNNNTLCSNAGTDVFPALDGRILLIEDMNAPMSGLERNWRHLERLGVFDRIAGLIVGKPEFPRDEGAPFSMDELLLEIVGDRDLPIVSNFDCAHTHPMLTLAQGAELTLIARPDEVQVIAHGPWVTQR